MPSRPELRQNLARLRSAVDLPLLLDTNVDPGVRSMLISGIAVSSYTTIESFVLQRAHEIADYLRTGATAFHDLTSTQKRTILSRAARNHAYVINATGMTEASLIAAAKRIGQDLSSIDQPSLALPLAAMSWSGSNLRASDVTEILKVLGCQSRQWESLTNVARRGTRTPPNTPPPVVKELFEAVANARHLAAHELPSPVTVTQLRPLPRAVLIFCFSFDCLASHLAAQLHAGRLADLPTRPEQSLQFRFVEPIGPQWRHIGESNIRGHRFDDAEGAWAAAVARAGNDRETVVRLDEIEGPADWLTVHCP